MRWVIIILPLMFYGKGNFLSPLPHNADRFNAFKKRVHVRQSLWRVSASYVDRILRDVDPADLPQQALGCNLKTARHSASMAVIIACSRGWVIE